MRRMIVVLVAGAALVQSVPAHARPFWKRRIDRITAGKNIGVSLRDDGRLLYQRDARTKRTPASNEKLFLSMALFDGLGPEHRIDTRVFAGSLPVAGVVTGNLWLTGHGDPTITAGGRYGRSLPLRPTRLRRLARSVKDAGITQVHGRVIGDTGYFRHDWFAPGWRSYFPADEVPLPSALTFEGNVHNRRHIRNPEFRAARAFTRKLEALGVVVTGRPGAGDMPGGLNQVARIYSAPLETLVRYMNRSSSNFFAEMLGKRLGAETYGPLGTIAKGAGAIERFAAARDITSIAHDSSGLSYRNRISAHGIVKMLTHVEMNEDYYEALRSGLPKGGVGTLENRLQDVRIRAKTGSLRGVSALSGWIYLERTGTWAEFSILSRGLDYYASKGLEDRIVRLAARYGR